MFVKLFAAWVLLAVAASALEDEGKNETGTIEAASHL